MFILMFLTVGDIIGRQLSAAIPGAYELTQVGMVILVYFSLGYTQVKKGHIAVDVIVAKFPQRMQASVDAVIHVLTLGIYALVTWQLFVHCNRLYLSNQITGVLTAPLWPFAVIAGVGSALFMLAVLSDLVHSIVKAVGK